MKSTACLVALALALTACTPSSQSPAPSPAPSPSAPVTSTAPAPTATSATEPCPVREGGSDAANVDLRDVRVGEHEGFDRVVLEFGVTSGGAVAVPGYRLAEASPPFSKDPSGQPMTVAGSAFVDLNLRGASGVDDSGNETYTGPEQFTPGFEVLVEAEQAGDFEAVISWVFGLSRRSCPTVAVLEGPTRIVLDFPHA